MTAMTGANSVGSASIVESPVGSLNGLFKVVYGELENLVPDGVKFTNSIEFVPADQMLGNLFAMPVVLGLEHGVTFASVSDGAFALNDPIAGTVREAQVQASQMLLRGALPMNAAARALKGGAQAFEAATKYLVGNMARSMSKKLEIELLYGQDGLGILDFSGGKTTAGASQTALYVTAASWADGIWSGGEGMRIGVWNETDTTEVDNTDSSTSATIAAVDLDNRLVTLSGSGINLTGLSAKTVKLYFYKARSKEMAGLKKILSNTGTLFNISATSFSLWKSTVHSAASGALSFKKIQDAIAKAVAKGLDGKVQVMVNPKTWSNLLNDQAALRRYDSGYKKDEFENGSSFIRFHGQNGEIEIVPSIYIKEGECFIYEPENFHRVGSTDVTFKRPGYPDQFFIELPSHAGYELRAYTEQALFSNAPGRACIITDIVNS